MQSRVQVEAGKAVHPAFQLMKVLASVWAVPTERQVGGRPRPIAFGTNEILAHLKSEPCQEPFKILIGDSAISGVNPPFDCT